MTQLGTTKYQTALNKHRSFLNKFSLFPAKTRKVIYAQCLSLPLNHNHFIQLTKQFPLLPQHTLDQQVSFIVSAITRLFPQLSIQWLPAIVYPFVRLFPQDAIIAFETTLTFIVNWLSPMFVNYPNAPSTIMSFLSNQLPLLQNAVHKLNYPLSALLWPSFQVLLTDILNREQFLILLDFLIVHPYSPQYLLCACVQVVAKVQSNLISIPSIEDISLNLRKQKFIDMGKLIQNITALAKQQPTKDIYSNSVFPLSKGRYTINKLIVGNQVGKIKTNPMLEKKVDLKRVNQKYNQLKKLIQERLRDEVADQNDINEKYNKVEGQMREYIARVRAEHQQKQSAILQMEKMFKEKINQQQERCQENYKNSLKNIQKKSNLHKDIYSLQQEAESLREAEANMMRNIQNIAQSRKEQLISNNNKLKQALKR